MQLLDEGHVCFSFANHRQQIQRNIHSRISFALQKHLFSKLPQTLAFSVGITGWHHSCSFASFSKSLSQTRLSFRRERSWWGISRFHSSSSVFFFFFSWRGKCLLHVEPSWKRENPCWWFQCSLVSQQRLDASYLAVRLQICLLGCIFPLLSSRGSCPLPTFFFHRDQHRGEWELRAILTDRSLKGTLVILPACSSPNIAC